MIAGYVDRELRIRCAGCWAKRPEGDLPPHIILDPKRDEDASDDFWIEDRCDHCGELIRYQRCELIGPAPWVVP